MIGIVGGGISGLAVARGLADAGVPHVLFEAEAEPGGVMRTVRVHGVPLDVGPQRTRLTRQVRALVEAAGLQDEVMTADEDLPLWVFRDGRLRRVPFRLSEAVTTDLLGWRGKLRILLEPLTGGLRPDETVERFFVRKFGREAYENLIGPLYGGLYASDPSRMYARHGLRITLEHFGVEGSLLLAMLRRGARARQAIETITFREGLQALPRGLAEADRANVRLATPVRALERRPDGGWRLRVDGAGGDEGVEVEAVVLSCPSWVAAGLLEPVAPEAARRIGSLRTNRLAVVHLGSDFQGEGFGYQVAFGEPLETRGCTWNASIFDRPGVFTCYLGGMKHPTLVDWPDGRIAATALDEFETVTGAKAKLLNVSRTYVPAWDGSWDALDGLEPPDGLHVCANWAARPGIPGRAVEAARVVRDLTGTPSRPRPDPPGDRPEAG